MSSNIRNIVPGLKELKNIDLGNMKRLTEAVTSVQKFEDNKIEALLFAKAKTMIHEKTHEYKGFFFGSTVLKEQYAQSYFTRYDDDDYAWHESLFTVHSRLIEQGELVDYISEIVRPYLLEGSSDV